MTLSPVSGNVLTCTELPSLDPHTCAPRAAMMALLPLSGLSHPLRGWSPSGQSTQAPGSEPGSARHYKLSSLILFACL